uniref:Uncharacterized protein n=1 Tax=Tanacetum cinerariifolium TaxID=118510 RepID=A0A6L2LVQ7_TANCI|nr:hypothetical protein [Tanacetum cinerariifolium]
MFQQQHDSDFIEFQSDVQQENREDDDIGGKVEAAPNMLTTLMKTSRGTHLGRARRSLKVAILLSQNFAHDNNGQMDSEIVKIFLDHGPELKWNCQRASETTS